MHNTTDGGRRNGPFFPFIGALNAGSAAVMSQWLREIKLHVGMWEEQHKDDPHAAGLLHGMLGDLISAAAACEALQMALNDPAALWMAEELKNKWRVNDDKQRVCYCCIE